VCVCVCVCVCAYVDVCEDVCGRTMPERGHPDKHASHDSLAPHTASPNTRILRAGPSVLVGKKKGSGKKKSGKKAGPAMSDEERAAAAATAAAAEKQQLLLQVSCHHPLPCSATSIISFATHCVLACVVASTLCPSDIREGLQVKRVTHDVLTSTQSSLHVRLGSAQRALPCWRGGHAARLPS